MPMSLQNDTHTLAGFPFGGHEMRNDRITKKDLRTLMQKAKEMIEQGAIPSPPVLKVRKGKRKKN